MLKTKLFKEYEKRRMFSGGYLFGKALGNKNSRKTSKQTPSTNERQKISVNPSTLSYIIISKSALKQGRIQLENVKTWHDGLLLLFYTIFYIVLAGMFAICMQGLLGTLSDSEPKWKLESSLIGTNPGMGYRPLSEETERGSIIQFDTQKLDEGKYWIELLDDFLSGYSGEGRKEKHCKFNQTHNPSDVCIVDVDEFGPCSKGKGYGYTNGRPCVFLKLNKIFNWQPDYYDDPTDLPVDMPEDLKEHIANTSQVERQQIWISCNGQRGSDKEKIGPISYYPRRGFPAFYYPYINQRGYLSPLVAVQFERLTTKEMISVECRAWARNIIYSGSLRDRMGSVSFQLLLD